MGFKIKIKKPKLKNIVKSINPVNVTKALPGGKALVKTVAKLPGGKAVTNFNPISPLASVKDLPGGKSFDKLARSLPGGKALAKFDPLNPTASVNSLPGGKSLSKLVKSMPGGKAITKFNPLNPMASVKSLPGANAFKGFKFGGPFFGSKKAGSITQDIATPVEAEMAGPFNPGEPMPIFKKKGRPWLWG